MAMQTVALVTYSGHPNLTPSDALLVPFLAKHEITANAAAWDEPTVDWQSFDAIIMRSAWNYHLKYPEFLSWLTKLENKHIVVWNSISILRWNTNKSYLLELEAKGIPIVPSIIIDRPDHALLSHLTEWENIVIKPTIAASAYNTQRFPCVNKKAWESYLASSLSQGAVIIQKFMPEISTGEYSFIFFNKQFSHAVLKVPKANDFRSQEEYGATAQVVEVSQDLIEQAQKVVDIIDDPLLYARVDGLVVDGVFMLMELELCEPHLFLESTSSAAKKFSDAIATTFKKKI